MSDNKVRKAINVSLQSKKYGESINEIIQDWESKNLNISAETCEALLLVHRLKKLSALSNVFNIVKMLDNLSTIYNYDDDEINNMLEQIIYIDNEKFSQILIELNNLEFTSTVKPNLTKKKKAEVNIEEKQKEKKEEENDKKEHLTKNETIEKQIIDKVKSETVNKKESMELEEDDSSPKIPFDFLMNS